MSVQAVIHLNFQGQARAALAFYQSVFGDEIMQVTYGESGKVNDAADADRIIYGQVKAPSGFHIMAYDVEAAKPWDQGRNAFFAALVGESQDEIRTLWNGLAHGADIEQPLAAADWSPLYGMLKDRFGVTWIVNVVVPVDGA
ncbi:PhnB protein [Massilia sp. UYP32]|uniref:VOC family protein n=1 Tax=Massilia sp. UYP32 TaxID=1756386 RepID=UPI003D2065EE